MSTPGEPLFQASLETPLCRSMDRNVPVGRSLFGMWHSHDAFMGTVFELVVAAFYANFEPPGGTDFPDYVSALHAGTFCGRSVAPAAIKCL